MDKKKILIVSVSFFPRISPRSFRATELAIEFSRQGHDVTVFTYHNDHYDYSEFSQQHNIKIVDFIKDKWPGFINWKTSKLKEYFFGSFKYFFQYPDIKLMWLTKKALKNQAGYDLLISLAMPYPVHWGVALARKRNVSLTRTWVADCGDPFIMNIGYRFKLPFYFRYIDRWYSGYPDYISISQITYINNYCSECHNKIVEIHQGFRFDNVKLAEEQERTGIIKFAFAGTFVKGPRDPKSFLQYLTTVKDDFRFIIYTNNDILVRPFYAVLKNKLVIKKTIPRETLLYELSKMDFLVNFGYDPKAASPSKLIDYSLTKRPILNIASDEINRKMVDEFLSRDYSNRFIVPDLEKYRIENIAGKFLELCNASTTH